MTPLPRLIGALGPVVAAAILGTDRRIVRTLRRAAAQDAGAMPLDTRSQLIAWRLRRLRNAGPLQEVDGRSLLLEDGWRNYRARRRARALTILPIVVAAALALLWLT